MSYETPAQYLNRLDDIFKDVVVEIVLSTSENDHGQFTLTQHEEGGETWFNLLEDYVDGKGCNTMFIELSEATRIFNNRVSS